MENGKPLLWRSRIWKDTALVVGSLAGALVLICACIGVLGLVTGHVAWQ